MSPEKQKATIPPENLPGAKEYFALATKRCASWPDQYRETKDLNADQAFEYLYAGGIDSFYVYLTKMRPTTLIFLLEKINKDNLETIFEDIKTNNFFPILTAVGKNGEKEDPSSVSRLVSLINKSGVDFSNEPAPKAKPSPETKPSTKPHVIPEDLEDLEKIDKLRAELMQYGYEVTPTEGDGKETIADLETLNKLIFEADEYANLRFARKEEDKEAEKKISYDHRFDEGGYKIVFAKEAEDELIDDTNATLWAKMIIATKAKMVFSNFRKYLKEKYPSRFAKQAEEKPAPIDKNATDEGL